MNRRGFISLLVGAAGAPLVPWRGLVEPTIFLPPKSRLDPSRYLTSDPKWFLPGHHPEIHKFLRRTYSDSVDLSEASLEEMLIQIRDAVDDMGKPIRLEPKYVWIIGGTGIT